MQLVVTAARVNAVAGRYGSRSTAATTVATTRVTTLVLASVVGVVLVVVILLHVTVVGRGHTLDFLAVLVGGSGVRPLIFTSLASPKIGCISKTKINRYLFCISLDFHYLCTEKMVEYATIFAVEPIKTRRNGYSERPIRQ